MRQNSFQKNGLLNIKTFGSNNNFGQSTGQLGRRTIEDIKNDMFKAKRGNHNIKSEEKNNSFNNNQHNMQTKIDYLKKLDNMNRWK